MKIYNVSEIFDNGEFIGIVTESGSVINLPEGKHYLAVELEEHTKMINVVVDLDEVGDEN